MVNGQAVLHIMDMGAVEWGAIVPDTDCRLVTATAQFPLRTLPAYHRLLQTVPHMVPRQALTRVCGVLGLKTPGSGWLHPARGAHPTPSESGSRPARRATHTLCRERRPRWEAQPSSRTRPWTWHWNPSGCSSRKPTSRRRARQTDSPGWDCGAEWRPSTMEARWSAG